MVDIVEGNVSSHDWDVICGDLEEAVDDTSSDMEVSGGSGGGELGIKITSSTPRLSSSVVRVGEHHSDDGDDDDEEEEEEVRHHTPPKLRRHNPSYYTTQPPPQEQQHPPPSFVYYPSYYTTTATPPPQEARHYYPPHHQRPHMRYPVYPMQQHQQRYPLYPYPPQPAATVAARQQTVSNADAYRYGPYCRLRPDREYYVPNAAMWFNRAINQAREKSGQCMLVSMFIRSPYRVEHLCEFQKILEEKMWCDSDEKLLQLIKDPVAAESKGEAVFLDAAADVVVGEKQLTALSEMNCVISNLLHVYTYYKSEQLKHDREPTMYVNRIIAAKEVQNHYLDKKTAPEILTWFAEEWKRVCAPLTDTVMKTFSNQRKRSFRSRGL